MRDAPDKLKVIAGDGRELVLQAPDEAAIAIWRDHISLALTPHQPWRAGGSIGRVALPTSQPASGALPAAGGVIDKSQA